MAAAVTLARIALALGGQDVTPALAALMGAIGIVAGRTTTPADTLTELAELMTITRDRIAAGKSTLRTMGASS